MTLTGRVERRDVGPGAWVLVTDDGRRFELEAGEELLKAGQKVEVEGRVKEDAMSVGMVGDFVIEVERVRRV